MITTRISVYPTHQEGLYIELYMKITNVEHNIGCCIYNYTLICLYTYIVFIRHVYIYVYEYIEFKLKYNHRKQLALVFIK